MEPLTALFDVNPVPLARARTVTTPSGKSRTFTPETSSAFRHTLRSLWVYHRFVRVPLDGDLDVTLLFWRNCRSIAQRGDLSNLVKAVEDAANPDRSGWSGLWHDDRQVRRLRPDLIDWGPDVRGRIIMRIEDYTPVAYPEQDLCENVSGCQHLFRNLDHGGLRQ